MPILGPQLAKLVNSWDMRGEQRTDGGLMGFDQ